MATEGQNERRGPGTDRLQDQRVHGTDARASDRPGAEAGIPADAGSGAEPTASATGQPDQRTPARRAAHRVARDATRGAAVLAASWAPGTGTRTPLATLCPLLSQSLS